MKFEATKDVLLKNVQTVENAVSTKTNLPILSNILIEAEDDGIVLTGTDLDVGIISTIPIKPSLKGAVTVPAKKFLDIIKELPPLEISVSLKKNNMVWVECGKSQFKIIGLTKDEFPQLPEAKNKNFISIQQKQLKKMLGEVGFAISRDETRHVLNGVLFIMKPSLIRLVATDGRRLAMSEAQADFPGIKEVKAVVPEKATQELGRALQDEGVVLIFFGENQAIFDLGQTKIVSRLIEGEFPNYEQVIPKEAKEKVLIPKEEFLASTKRAGLFSSQDSIAIKMELSKDRLVMSKATPYLGEVKEELAVEYKGKDITIGFNPQYLIDVLRVIDTESVGLEVVDADKPGVIRVGKEYVYVVLPMQLT